MQKYTRANPFGLPIIGHAVLAARACPKCAYNLVGLKTGNNCPECGTPIGVGKSTGVSAEFEEVSFEYLSTTRTGALLIAAAVCVFAIMALASVFPSMQRLTVGSPMAMGVQFIFTSAALMWAAGVHLITFPIPGLWALTSVNKEPREARQVWRFLCRYSQWLLFAGSMLGLTLHFAGVARGGAGIQADVVRTISNSATLIGVLGIVPTFVYASMLAGWAGDEVEARRLLIGPLVAVVASVVFGVPLSMIMSYAEMVGYGFFMAMGSMLLATALCWGCYMLIRGVVGFASLYWWAVTNRVNASVIRQRTTERIARRVHDNTFHE